MTAPGQKWERLMAGARRRLNSYDFRKAEEKLREAVALSEKFPAGDPRRPETWFRLAECLAERTETRREAIEWYGRAAEEMEAIHGAQHAGAGKVYYAWGIAWFLSTREHERMEAAPLWERAVELFQGDPEKHRIDLWTALRDLAHLRYHVQKNPPGALPLLRRALEIATPLEGLDPAYVLADRQLLAWILKEQERWDEAAGAYRAYAEMADEVGEGGPAEAKDACHHAAKFFLGRKALDDAETYCLRALAWEVRAHDRKSAGSDVATIRNLSAEGLFKSFVEVVMNEQAQVAPPQRETLSELLEEVRRGKCDWPVLDTLWQVYAAGGRRAMAESVLDHVLDLVRNAPSENSLVLSRLLRSKGELRAQAGDFDHAERCLREAVAAGERVLKNYSGAASDLVEILRAYGKFLAERGREGEGREFEERARAVKSLPRG